MALPIYCLLCCVKSVRGLRFLRLLSNAGGIIVPPSPGALSLKGGAGNELGEDVGFEDFRVCVGDFVLHAGLVLDDWRGIMSLFFSSLLAGEGVRWWRK